MMTQSGHTPSGDDATDNPAAAIPDAVISGPAISIIVPAYGVTTMLADALDSLIAQDRGDWEAVVIDDGDARVADHVAPYAHDPRIRLVQTDNGGLSTARNRAMAQARAPLIALLDGDDIYEPDYVSTMIAAIEASPKIGLVSCDATYFGIDRVGELFSAYCPQQAPVTLEAVLRRRFNIFICTTMRREAIEEIGGFDTSLRSAEDLDAWLRIIEAGWEVAHVARPLARYRRRAGQMSSNVKAMLHAALAVFDHARTRLAGRPEALAADAMCATIERDIEADAGLAQIRAGEVREGLAKVVQARVADRSLTWRITIGAMRITPWLARPLLRWRERL